MASAYHGMGSSALEDQWKSVGNNQSSFARNPEALEAWFQMRLHDIFKDHYNRTRVSPRTAMLSENKTDRPKSEQIMPSLSDISIFVPGRGYEIFDAVCQEPLSCVGLSCAEGLNNPAYSIVERLDDPHGFTKYLFPLLNKVLEYWMFDMDWSDVSKEPRGELVPLPKSLARRLEGTKQAGVDIYSQASRTRTAKHFWEAYQRQGKSEIAADGKDDVWLTSQLVLAKHVMFMLPGQMNSTLILLDTTMISLIPIRLPQSPYYGSFFWIFSWSTHDERPASCVDPKRSESFRRVVNLTLEDKQVIVSVLWYLEQFRRHGGLIDDILTRCTLVFLSAMFSKLWTSMKYYLSDVKEHHVQLRTYEL